MLCCPVCKSENIRHFMHIDAHDYWRCENCQATCVDSAQLPEPALAEKHYRLHRNEINDPAYRQFLSRLCSPLLERLHAQSSGLDYGCGPGPALANMLAEAGHHMAIYDPLFYKDAGVLEVTYDFITCTEVAEHFHQPFEEFTRLNRLLKQGGMLAIMTLFQNDDDAFANWYYRRDPTHVVFYREATFQVLAKHFGWQLEIPCNNVVLLKKRVSETEAAKIKANE